MRYEIIFAPQAVQDLKRLSTRNRTTVRDTIEKHLRFEPDKVSQSRIKRLQGIRRPQYRLLVGDIRVFYDIVEQDVEILAIVPKSEAADWLAEMGEVT
jgi:mRNA-degrading endonuclease RelE of RelBE toxin-antitoxin system